MLTGCWVGAEQSPGCSCVLQTGHLDPVYLGNLMQQHKVDTIMSWVPSAVQGFLNIPVFKEV